MERCLDFTILWEAAVQFLKTGDVLVVRVGMNSTAAGGRRRESEFVPRSAETKVVKPKVTAGNRKPDQIPSSPPKQTDTKRYPFCFAFENGFKPLTTVGKACKA